MDSIVCSFVVRWCVSQLHKKSPDGGANQESVKLGVQLALDLCKVELQRVWAEPLRHLRLLNTYLEHRCKVRQTKVEQQDVLVARLRLHLVLSTYPTRNALVVVDCEVSFRTAWHARKHLRSVRQLQGDKEIEDELLAILPKNLRLHLLYEVASGEAASAAPIHDHQAVRS
eukprot:1904869-Amphidinium_carterae.1